MADYLSPGIFVKEADYSDYAQDTSTCIVGCVGEAKRGPVGVPTLVTSQAELFTTFGYPTEGQYGIYSAAEVLSQASQLYYTRVVRSATKATAGVEGTDKVIYSALSAGTDMNGYKIIQTALDSDGKFDVEVQDASGTMLEEYKGVTTSLNDADYIVSKVNNSSKYIEVTVMVTGTITANTFVMSGAVDSGKCATAGTSTDKLNFKTIYFDSTLNGGSAIVSDEDSYGYFSVTIVDVDGEVIETWQDVTLDKNDDRSVTYIINSSSSRVSVSVNDSATFESGVLTFSGGDDGIDNISNSDIIGSIDDTGIYSFSNSEMISIDVLIVPGKTDISVINAALSVCEDRGDTIFVADTPYGLSATQVTAWANGTGTYVDHASFNSSYGAFYWPWLKVSDSFSKKNIWLPPSGFVVAKYAFNDKVSYPWNAPAGLNRGLITDALAVEKSPTKGERDTVYGNRNVVNPIANFLSDGLVIWGQKTMQRKPTALDRVNVRRLLCYLKRQIGSSVRYFVFEQNNSSTWERLKTVIDPILKNVKSNGGLYEYKISISPSSDDIENNRMPVNVYIKPTKTAEYIPLTFNVMSYTASFNDV